MTLPLFTDSKAHFKEASLWASRLTSYPERERKQVVACIVKHLKMGIAAKH